MIDMRRLQRWFLRNYRARVLGIRFGRSTKFSLPASFVIDTRRVQPLLPDENGVKMAFIDIFLDDCYGLKRLPHSIGKILDIGGHVGLFSLAARAAFPQAAIHSYEPNPFLKKFLNQQAQIGKFDYFMEAVGLEDGKVHLDYHPDSVQTRSCEDAAGQIVQTAFRKTILRMGGFVDLLKLDCEGAEWQLFQDTGCWQKIKNVSMEYHLWPNHTHDEVFQVLKDLGFRIRRQDRKEKNFGILTARRVDT